MNIGMLKAYTRYCVKYVRTQNVCFTADSVINLLCRGDYEVLNMGKPCSRVVRMFNSADPRVLLSIVNEEIGGKVDGKDTLENS